MELTIEQALRQGVAAHKEGKLQDAERFYRAIIQSQPLHPDANHNLGVIAVSVNKSDAALPLFKTALETNPKIEQFWLSYINALIKEKQFENAKQVLEQAKKQGVARDKVDAIEAQITTTQVNEPKLVVQKKSLTLPEKRKKLVGEKKQKKEKKQNLKGNNPSDTEIKSLLEHYQIGQYDDAEKLAQSLTERFPEHRLGWNILGAIFGQTGRSSEAINFFQKSVELSPQDPGGHNNLGNTLKNVGRLDEAEASFRKAIALKPDFAEAHSNLGATLKELCRLDEAEASYTEAIALKADFATAHNNLGNTLKELGRLDEAEASFRKTIALKPDFALAHYNLGNTLQELVRLEEAEASYAQAIAVKPDYAEARNNLGVILRELGRFDEAIASYTLAIAVKPDYAETHNNLGVILQELNRLEEAEASLRQAIALKTDYADAYCNLCELLEKTNKVEETLLVIENAKVNVVEKGADFLFYEALILFKLKDYEMVEELIKKISKEELSEGIKPSFMKLKADVHHHKKDYSAAFEEFKSMNEYVKDSQEYKKQQADNYFNHQRDSIFQLEQLQQQTLYKSVIEPSWNQPTFLIGFPRSGTTLLDTILRSHSNIDVLEEVPMVEKMNDSLEHVTTISMIEDMDNAAAEIASGFYYEELKKNIEVGKKQIVIDKLPLNILMLPLINQVFPKAKFIMALRHPLDCVLSCWMQNFKLNPAMANMVELERVADFYCTAMKILTLSQERYSLDIHRIRYEELVVDFKGSISNLLTFLNLKWEEELKNYQKTALARGKINTPSYTQVIKPIYKTSSYRWKNYEEYLEPYKSRLAPWIREYGYSS
ncbi:tetratricopeptide repeat protein [Gammaproteobacteria bacterium]|nr:tetratricopeptide repeat protein [Gammaproteobacteria bacterium]